VGTQAVKRPAYYAPTGTRLGDLVAVLHPPYTAWHLSYVAMGAALAPYVDWLVLAGTLLAFFFGTGIAAHALDELHGRPLHTSLSDSLLRWLGVGGMAAALGLAVVGAIRVSLGVVGWAVVGMGLAAGYALERPALLHTPLGFAVAWGGFPVLVGYWAQAQSISPGALAVAAAATFLSLTQRTLSTPARHLRRNVDRAELLLHRPESDDVWDEKQILATWERPLRLLAWAMVTLAIGLLAARA
jgi:hypothetical protein